MTTSLILITASGLAREVIAALEGRIDLRVVGIVDDAPNRAGALVGGVRVLGASEVVLEHPDTQLLICAGRGVTRRVLRDRPSRLGVSDDRFATMVGSTVRIPPSAHVGAGSILLDGTVLTADVSIGRHVVTMPHVTLTHDNRLDDYATICAGVSLGGGVSVGRAAYLGMNASVREDCTIGDGATLGMGATLLQDLPAGETWVGVPAQSRRRLASSQPFPRNFETNRV